VSPLPTDKADFFERTRWLLPELVTMAGTIMADTEHLAAAHATKDQPMIAQCAKDLANHQSQMLKLTAPLLEHLIMDSGASFPGAKGKKQ
jgi:hypothetical protein